MKPLIRSKPLLGTFVEVGALHTTTDTALVATNAAFCRITRIQQLLSFHDPASDLSRLNHAGGEAMELQPLSIRVIALAKQLSHLSNHSFNCTVGGTMVRKGLLPSHLSRTARLSGHADDIQIQGRMVRLLNGISLTLDGIAKGYAVDLAVSALKHHGIKCGWVNAGGDLRVFGDHTIPVHVRAADGRIISLGRLVNAAMASSSSIAAPEHGFYGEIIGDNVSPDPQVWTVIARHAWLADALTKVAANSLEPARSRLLELLGGRLALPSA